MSSKYYEGNWSEQREIAKLEWDKISYAELEQSRANELWLIKRCLIF